MKVKICGITRKEDAIICEKLGIDYLGFNFYSGSKRFIKPESAKFIISELKKIKTIGVFVENDLDSIKKIVEFCGLDGIQIHSEQSPVFCNKIKREFPGLIIIQAFRIKGSIPENINDFDADYFIFDSFDERQFGGTGKIFDWKILDKAGEVLKKTFIAGGVNPDNVEKIVFLTNIYGIDVASGVEISPGIKDKNKIKCLLSKIGRLNEKDA
ncbi:MAG: phosphoribosylanthranilate isomerase [Candidatus Omnitrophica bacterium]|nr:phosphoribosylanthranilate isomerase [Candidatus Omnitrophota bacterium]